MLEKAPLIDAPEIECPNKMENIEKDIQEEQILDTIEGFFDRKCTEIAKTRF